MLSGASVTGAVRKKKPGQGGMGGGALQGIFPPHHRGEGDGGLIGKTQGEIEIAQPHVQIHQEDTLSLPGEMGRHGGAQ